jgi:uncharacterized protein YceH (UPF0502 family)
MSTHPELNAHEARLLGVLFEKERTTPDQYPLSLHALTAGANQKSNRDPATDWSEAEVLVGLTGLIHKGLAGKVSVAGSRVDKYRQNARETLGVGDARLALLSELLMRGPQTVGELRTRAGRMHDFHSTDAVLAELAAMAGAGLVRRLDAPPGSRAERWLQLLCPGLHPIPSGDESAPPQPRAQATQPGLSDRVAALEQRVQSLERALQDLGAL